MVTVSSTATWCSCMLLAAVTSCATESNFRSPLHLWAASLSQGRDVAQEQEDEQEF